MPRQVIHLSQASIRLEKLTPEVSLEMADFDSNPSHVYTGKDGVAATYAPAPRRRLGGAWRDICLGFTVVTVPMLLFNFVLIGLIAALREPNSRETIKHEGAIFVDISATTFTTVASLASTVAAVLGGFLVLLAAYPSAKKMATASCQGNSGGLPSPYQLMMIMEIRAGSVWRTIWRLVGYFTS